MLANRAGPVHNLHDTDSVPLLQGFKGGRDEAKEGTLDLVPQLGN
jgi:hypothetical protein